MYDPKTLDEEIAAAHEQMDSEGGRRKRAWLVQAVTSQHQNITGPDADLALWAIHSQVSNAVQKFYSRLKVSADAPDQQMVLPGYERLQRYYLITSEGEELSVELSCMTDAEIDSKVAEMQAMRRGLEKHIEELLQYKAERKQAAGRRWGQE